jgi:UDP-N-acetylenolpyruvoylglucosamine reductase
MYRIRQIINGIILFSFALSASADLVKFCNKAAPQLGCDTLSSEDLQSLHRMCRDASKTLEPWSGYAIGATEKPDRTGALTLLMNSDKQGSANGRTPCTQFQAYRYPQTEYDVVAALSEAQKNNWKIKAVGAAHTDNELICGDGMALSNRCMNKIFEIETFEGQETVRAQPGVTLRQLGEWLHKRHKSFGFAVVGFEAVTLGGVIGTGAHGSSIHDTAILSDIVQSFRVVAANGQVHEITRRDMEQKNPDLWRALGVNLGMMGIVTEVRLRIQEDFQLRVASKKLEDDRLFVDGEGILSYISECDTASFHWFPQRPNSKGRLFRNCGQIIRRGSQSWKKFSKNVDKGAQYILHAPDVPQVYVSFVKKLLHKGVCDSSEHFKVESIRRFDLRFHPPYAKNRTVPVYGLSPLASHPHGITGWSFAMQNSVSSEEGDEYRQTDWEVAVPAKKSPEVFRFLRDFMNGKDASYEKAFPLQSVGFFIRFSKASPSLMSHAAIGGDFHPGDTVMFLELSEYLPTFDVRNENEKRIAKAIMDEYERPFRVFLTELVKRFGARAHWAKNRQEFFRVQEQNADRQKQISVFARQVKALDPKGLFSNSLSAALFSN